MERVCSRDELLGDPDITPTYHRGTLTRPPSVADPWFTDFTAEKMRKPNISLLEILI